MTTIEMRTYAPIEARMAVARWFTDRYAENAVARMREIVAIHTSDHTTMLAEVHERELPDLLGALVLMQG
jgi:hypothetical protein